MIIEGPHYGTEAWDAFRCGKVTASRFADAMTKGRGGFGVGKTAESYMFEVVASAITGKLPSGGRSAAMDRGKDMEQDAITRYETMRMVDVGPGRILQRAGTIICATPDGFVDDDPEGPGIIEVKCPNSSTHLKTWNNWRIREAAKATHLPPEEYVEQVQGQLWVSGRAWCDFITFDDRFPGPLQYLAYRVYRDEELIERMATAVGSFAEECEQRIAQLRSFLAEMEPAQADIVRGGLQDDLESLTSQPRG